MLTYILHRRRPMQKLQAKDARVVPKADHDDVGTSSALLTFVDAVPAVSGLAASGKHYSFPGKQPSDIRNRMFSVRVKIAPFSTCAKRRRRTLRMRIRFWSDLMAMTGDDGLSLFLLLPFSCIL